MPHPRRLFPRHGPGFILPGFLLPYAIPGVIVLCAWLARRTTHPDLVTAVPLALAFVVVPLVEMLWPRPAARAAEAETKTRWRLYYRLLPAASLPAQLAMLFVAGDLWQSDVLGVPGRAALLLATGIYSGMFAITIAHELIHRRSRVERGLGGLLLSTVGFGVFKIVHLQIHHRLVGTPLDFATAPRGQTVYAFWRQSWAGNFAGAWRQERRRLAKAGRPLRHSELFLWYGASLAWLGLGALFWGVPGIVFLVVQSVVAITKLDCINYLQHYGLTRRPAGAGQFEPVAARHSWAHVFPFDELVLFNLPRHADHHMHPQLPYEQTLRIAGSPEFPYPYGVMVLLSLVPPLFRQVMHPRLDRWQIGTLPVPEGAHGAALPGPRALS
jgi:alkane 1-monooxygenase